MPLFLVIYVLLDDKSLLQVNDKNAQDVAKDPMDTDVLIVLLVVRDRDCPFGHCTATTSSALATMDTSGTIMQNTCTKQLGR